MSALLDRLVPPAEPKELPEQEPHPSGNDRYAIYAAVIAGDRQPRGIGRVLTRGRECIAETSLDGIGGTLVKLREEGQITNDTRVGILDRVEHVWIVNPWARGDATGNGRREP